MCKINGNTDRDAELGVGVGIVCTTVCWGSDQRKDQCSASLAFVRGIHQWPENISIMLCGLSNLNVDWWITCQWCVIMRDGGSDVPINMPCVHSELKWSLYISNTPDQSRFLIVNKSIKYTRDETTNHVLCYPKALWKLSSMYVIIRITQISIGKTTIKTRVRRYFIRRQHSIQYVINFHSNYSWSFEVLILIFPIHRTEQVHFFQYHGRNFAYLHSQVYSETGHYKQLGYCKADLYRFG